MTTLREQLEARLVFDSDQDSICGDGSGEMYLLESRVKQILEALLDVAEEASEVVSADARREAGMGVYILRLENAVDRLQLLAEGER